VAAKRTDHVSNASGQITCQRQRHLASETDARAYVVLRMVPPDGSAHPHTVDLEGVALPAA